MRPCVLCGLCERLSVILRTKRRLFGPLSAEGAFAGSEVSRFRFKRGLQQGCTGKGRTVTCSTCIRIEVRRETYAVGIWSRSDLGGLNFGMCRKQRGLHSWFHLSVRSGLEQRNGDSAQVLYGMTVHTDQYRIRIQGGTIPIKGLIVLLKCPTRLFYTLFRSDWSDLRLPPSASRSLSRGRRTDFPLPTPQ